MNSTNVKQPNNAMIQRERWETIYGAIFNKQVIVICILFTILIMFNKPVIAIFTDTIVDHFMCVIESTWYNDLIFIIIFLIYLFYVYIAFRRKKISTFSNFLLQIIIIFLYAFERFLFKNWCFTHFTFYSDLKYADLLILAYLGMTIVFIINRVNPKPIIEETNTHNEAWYDDEPIGTSKNNNPDLSNFTPVAQSIAIRIKNSHLNRAYSIGINGKWGSGKTSFFNILKQEITEVFNGGDTLCDFIKSKVVSPQFIQIDFNPWSNNSPNAIVQDFFDIIKEKIGPYNSSVLPLISSYTEKLLSIKDNTLLKTIRVLSSIVFGDQSKERLFLDINNILSDLNLKIIIYIDDVDRLDKDEIIEVLRLIRNTANFKNTFFVVAYDRDYVINALKEYTSFNQEKFLEKIFQIEIPLPNSIKNIFLEKLSKLIKDKLDSQFHLEIDKQLLGKGDYNALQYIEDWVENMRDSTRLANLILLNVSELLGEISLRDFLGLELLKLKYPSVYALLYNYRDEFFEEKNSSNTYCFILKTTADQTATYPYILEKYLVDNCLSLSVPMKEIPKIINLINLIFDSTDYMFSMVNKNHLSVVYPSKFDRYFRFKLSEGDFSEIEFSNARMQEQIDFNSKIKELIERGFVDQLVDNFTKINHFDNREDFEKVICAIFFLANQKKQDAETDKDVVGYDGTDIRIKLHKNILTERFYSDENGAEDLKLFVKSVLNNPDSSHYFDSEFIRDFNQRFQPDKTSSYTFPLNYDEITEIAIGYLKKELLEKTKFTPKIWYFYYNCKYSDFEEFEGSYTPKIEELPVEVKTLIRDFILTKDIDGFIVFSIEPNVLKTSFSIKRDIVFDLFGNWNDFKSAIKLMDNAHSRYLSEYKTFIDRFDEINFIRHIEYSFSVIPTDKVGLM